VRHHFEEYIMRGYATSRFRLLLLGLMLAAVVATAATTFGQDATAGAAAAAPKGASTFQLVFSNLNDPIFWIIAILSVIALTLIIQGFIQNRSEALMPEETTNRIREMIGARQFKELIDFTDTDPSFISRSLNPALKRAPSFSSMKEAMETAIGEQTAEQFRKIEYLNIIGNLGPLLGLLGTVLGMIEAFQAVAATKGQADVGALSQGISTALTNTFLGLFLAVPCLASFGVLRTIVDRLTVRGALIAEELLLMIKPAETKPGPAAPAPQQRPMAVPSVVPPPPPARKMPAPGLQ
jgi:biopolymer transport protein ExbB